MSLLLDHGPHSIVVFPEEDYTDTRGNPRKRPAEVGVTVTGVLMTPISSARDPLSDRRIDGGYRLMARTAPLGPWAAVEFNGRRFTVEAGPVEHASSPATTHVSATLIPAD
ncbi:hypothetical protein [Pseudonocardia sp. TRM90224]|uniref:hypothetical protein n=1 Tax=Pseudonocardia sp. TRM90224 TaxID=2812678 RepID=UPI001E48B46F|nr:hypothetical protein [Pseudonocardia sp. TRM90224]